jgi:hypothetical protein
MTNHHNHDNNAGTNRYAPADSAMRDRRMSVAARNLRLSTRIGVAERANHRVLGAMRA